MEVQAECLKWKKICSQKEENLCQLSSEYSNHWLASKSQTLHISEILSISRRNIQISGSKTRETFSITLCAVLLKICHKLRRISTYLFKGKNRDKLYDESSSSLIVSTQKNLTSYFVPKLLSWKQSDIFHGLLVQALAFFFRSRCSHWCCHRHVVTCAHQMAVVTNPPPLHTHALPPPHAVMTQWLTRWWTTRPQMLLPPLCS